MVRDIGTMSERDLNDHVSSHDAAHWLRKSPRERQWRDEPINTYLPKTPHISMLDILSAGIFGPMALEDNPVDISAYPGKYRVTYTATGELLAQNISHALALRLRDISHGMGIACDIVESDTLLGSGAPLFNGFAESFPHTDNRDPNPRMGGIPEPPIHDWKRREAQKRAQKQNYFRQAKFHETHIESFVNEKDHHDFLMRHGFSVIDVRTLTVIGSGSEHNCREYIKQRAARRGDYIYNYRVVRYSQRGGYLLQTRNSGFSLFYLGQVICQGSKDEIRFYLSQRHIDDLEKNGKIGRIEFKTL